MPRIVNQLSKRHIVFLEDNLRVFAFAEAIGEETAHLRATLLLEFGAGQLFDHLLHLDEAPDLVQGGDVLGLHAVETVVEAEGLL